MPVPNAASFAFPVPRMFSLDSTWRGAWAGRSLIAAGNLTGHARQDGVVPRAPCNACQVSGRDGAEYDVRRGSKSTDARPKPTSGWCVPSTGMVVSVSQAASEAGRDILARGGTAVDAAVATALVLAVTYPEAGNIGGGGFMLVYPGDGRPVECIDYRETAPAAPRPTCSSARRTAWVTKWSACRERCAAWRWPMRGSASCPGKNWWRRRRGWPAKVLPSTRRSPNRSRAYWPKGAILPELERVYGKPDRTPWQAGDRFVLPELAQTLRTLADEGAEAFYRGRIAEQIVAEMQAGGGLITADDLAGYEAKTRPAIHGTFRGYDIYGPPLPSSGGIVLVEMLNMLETFDLARLGRWSPAAQHLTIEVMRRAYRDRAAYLGDSDFVAIPDRLTDKAYARQLAAGIDPAHATASADLAGDIPLAAESPHTTHFSVIDRPAWRWPTPTRWNMNSVRTSWCAGPDFCSTTRCAISIGIPALPIGKGQSARRPT